MNNNTTELRLTTQPATQPTTEAFTEQQAYNLIDDILFNADEIAKEKFCELLRNIAHCGDHAAHIAKFSCRYAYLNYNSEIDRQFESYLGDVETEPFPQPQPQIETVIRERVAPPLKENQTLYGVKGDSAVELKPRFRNKPFVLPKEFDGFMIVHEFGGEQ